MFDDDLPSDIETTKGASFDNVTGIVGFPWITEKTSSSYTFIFGRRKSRSMNHDRINLSWSMLVKKPARSWLTKMRSASTGASRRMDNNVYTSPVAKWSGQADGMS